jgi:DNA-dependent RNA polymerase auxiliary subunit epsilon
MPFYTETKKISPDRTETRRIWLESDQEAYKQADSFFTNYSQAAAILETLFGNGAYEVRVQETGFLEASPHRLVTTYCLTKNAS